MGGREGKPPQSSLANSERGFLPFLRKSCNHAGKRGINRELRGEEYRAGFFSRAPCEGQSPLADYRVSKADCKSIFCTNIAQTFLRTLFAFASPEYSYPPGAGRERERERANTAGRIIPSTYEEDPVAAVGQIGFGCYVRGGEEEDSDEVVHASVRHVQVRRSMN